MIDIAILHEKRGMWPAEIVDQFPGITLADVHAALVYFLDHCQEIEDDNRHDEVAMLPMTRSSPLPRRASGSPQVRH